MVTVNSYPLKQVAWLAEGLRLSTDPVERSVGQNLLELCHKQEDSFGYEISRPSLEQAVDSSIPFYRRGSTKDRERLKLQLHEKLITANGLGRDLFKNPLSLAGFISETVFTADKKLGHKFKNGEVVGAQDFQTIDDWMTCYDPRKPFVLNIGDSSVSGWNGEVYHSGIKNDKEAMFTYRTYSDLLRDTGAYNVMNAGVPGYSSYQAKVHLQSLLHRLWQRGLRPSYVTIYVGNNDSVSGKEDKYFFKRSLNKARGFGTRVTAKDFTSNLETMIAEVRKINAEPIIIVPLVNYFHEPYLRSRLYREDSEFAISAVKDPFTKLRIAQAQAAWQRGDYITATALDKGLSRISPEHMTALKSVIKKHKVRAIDLQSRLNIKNPQDAEKFFVDYCHPNEQTNDLIAAKIKEAIDDPNLDLTCFEDLVLGAYKRHDVWELIFSFLAIVGGFLPGEKRKKDDINIYPFY